MNSYWIDSVENITKNFKTLDSDMDTDVCIIGGGITGLTCAYLLSKQGLRVTVLEKDKLAIKTTGNTTAKITSQHGLFYNYLINSFSKEFAQSYLDANEQAIKNIQDIIIEENIDCDFENKDSYVFARTSEELIEVQKEISALSSLNFDAQFVDKIDIPINTLGAIKFPNQAQFHPRKYLVGLCNAILSNNSNMYEDSKVIDIKKEHDSYITYINNFKVLSKYVILATRYPIINAPGFYFLKMYQESSYIIGIKADNVDFDGMYISSGEPTLSFRTVTCDNDKLVLIGGSNHKVGAKIDLTDSYNFLERTAQDLFPNSEILYRWESEDCISLDKIPYIGEFSNLMPNMFVATGYKKWGMTSSNVAANIICDKILGKKNDYEKVFLSTRLEPIKNIKELGNIFKEVTYSLGINKLNIPDDTINDVNNNEGKIVEVDEKKVGVYKDNYGKIYAIKPTCTHLGCELSWNNLNNSWDCPCHGSRFDYTGKLLYGPSIHDLEKFN